MCNEFCTLHTFHRFQAKNVETALQDHCDSFAEEQPTHVYLLDLSWNIISDKYGTIFHYNWKGIPYNATGNNFFCISILHSFHIFSFLLPFFNKMVNKTYRFRIPQFNNPNSLDTSPDYYLTAETDRYWNTVFAVVYVMQDIPMCYWWQ